LLERGIFRRSATMKLCARHTQEDDGCKGRPGSTS
jgi:hypothetical protein